MTLNSAITIAILLTSLSCATPPRAPDAEAPVSTPSPEAAVKAVPAPINATQFVYQVPPGPADLAEGEVKIVAMGWTEIRTHNDESAKLPALHIRLIVERGGEKNDVSESDTQDWSLDARLQQIQFAGSDDVIRPLFVSSASRALPYVRVGTNQQTAVELYYPLPAPLALAARHTPFPKFNLRWSVLTNLQSVSETTQLAELYPEISTKTIYPNLSQQRTAKLRTPAAAAKMKISENQEYWWQDPFGDVPPAFSTIGIW